MVKVPICVIRYLAAPSLEIFIFLTITFDNSKQNDGNHHLNEIDFHRLYTPGMVLIVLYQELRCSKAQLPTKLISPLLRLLWPRAMSPHHHSCILVQSFTFSENFGCPECQCELLHCRRDHLPSHLYRQIECSRTQNIDSRVFGFSARFHCSRTTVVPGTWSCTSTVQA